MKEVLDVLVWVGFVFILFVFLRGMNKQQVEKHKQKLEDVQKKKENKAQKEEKI